MAAVACDDHVAVAGADAGVPPGNQVRVAGVAGEPPELPRETQSVAFREAARQADVLAGAVVVAVAGGLLGEVVEALDAVGRDGHTDAGAWVIEDSSGRIIGRRRFAIT
jgi:hypothetical protein